MYLVPRDCCAAQVLAVQTEFHASLFALWLWVYGFVLIFQILHSSTNAGVALSTLAIGVYSLVSGSTSASFALLGCGLLDSWEGNGD